MMSRFTHKEAIVLDVTSRCNFQCSHCLRGKRFAEDVSLDLLDKICTEGKSYGLNMISFSGGEPILNKDFNRMLDLLVSKDYWFNFVTNGFLYRDYDYVFKYKGRLTQAIISSDGATQESYESMRDGKGFENSWRAMNFFSEAGVKVRLQVCLSTTNYRQIPEIIDKAIVAGVSHIAFGSVSGDFDNCLNNEQRYWCWNMICRYAYGKIDFSALSNLGIRNVRECLALIATSSPRIDSKGNFYTCCDMRDDKGLVGNIWNTSYHKIREKAMIANGILAALSTKYYLDESNDDKFDTCDFCMKHWSETKEIVDSIGDARGK